MCSSLAFQPQEELKKTLDLASKAGVTVVSLPLVNQWTQDRSADGGRTPRWRGITLMHEAKKAGVPVAIASDNTRDQFYAYGDLDMLEVFNQGCRMAHLDRPYGNWIQSVTSVPADAMKLHHHGRIKRGIKANFIIFPTSRKYSELLSRAQTDRIVIRNGKPINTELPSYEELDYIPNAVRQGNVPVMDVKYDPVSGAVIWKAAIGVNSAEEDDTGSPIVHPFLGSTQKMISSEKSSTKPEFNLSILLVEWLVFFFMSNWIIYLSQSSVI